MKKYISDKAVVMGSVIFMVMNNYHSKIEDKEVKKLNEELMSEIKNKLAERRSGNSSSYKELLEKSLEYSRNVKDNLLIGDVTLEPKLSPADMLKILHFKYGDIYEELELNEKYATPYCQALTPSGMTLNTLVFVNRLLAAFEETCHA